MRRLGKSYPHPFVVLVVLASPLPQVRVGVMAGRRVGGAVQRNRAKRVLRAAIQPLLGALAPGYDVILIARPGVLAANSREAQAVLQRQLQRAKLL
ncbi:MAG: ribonuclease P protein component [Anaerolineales bacterium]|nr:ribonuclease P protein component [Anaerolineales bacterium]MBX3006122.1 ribonuclease P protein component [Anaerolineales bacterium]